MKGYDEEFALARQTLSGRWLAVELTEQQGLLCHLSDNTVRCHTCGDLRTVLATSLIPRH